MGVDLVKDPALLVAAYDDAQGVTAAFNRNILCAVNRLLDADFDPSAFEHCARYDAVARRIEMRLLARRDVDVRIGADRRRFARGESILTEYSHKYTLAGFAQLLARAGFVRQRAWTDAAGWYGVFVAGPA